MVVVPTPRGGRNYILNWFFSSDNFDRSIYSRGVFYSTEVFALEAIFVPTHFSGGGIIYSNGFFVQTTLADRYNHRRELWVVSLKSPSSVEYGIRKIFFIFIFYGELSRFKLLRILEVFQLFYSHFWYFWPNFSQFC